MRVCLILEGSYPYVHGGVSSWTHAFIKQFPEIDFVLWMVGANAASRGRFVYELPENVVEVHELFLDDALRAGAGTTKRAQALTDAQRRALQRFIACDRPDWKVLRDMVREDAAHPLRALQSRDFIEEFTDLCRASHPHTPFAQAFYTVRSMAMPVLYLLAQDIPQADLYHPVSTGYAGLLGAVAKLCTGRPLVLTEHGIYSREREEEIIRSDWVLPYFKREWISFFYMLSAACYDNADQITCLFSNARATQIELGANPSRCTVIPNGIDFDRFSGVPAKADNGRIDIGAPIRLAPIKDVKTLILAFYELSHRLPNVHLYILGSTDDEDYARECRQLVDSLGASGIEFTGQVDMVEYMAKFDFTVLSSISEGQPLSVLESFSAARPVVMTDVGCCRELAEGAEGDTFGRAGIIVPPMDYEAFADAMQELCEDAALRRRMGNAGRNRAGAYFRQETMVARYRSVYERAMGQGED